MTAHPIAPRIIHTQQPNYSLRKIRRTNTNIDVRTSTIWCLSQLFDSCVVSLYSQSGLIWNLGSIIFLFVITSSSDIAAPNNYLYSQPRMYSLRARCARRMPLCIHLRPFRSFNAISMRTAYILVNTFTRYGIPYIGHTKYAKSIATIPESSLTDRELLYIRALHRPKISLFWLGTGKDVNPIHANRLENALISPNILPN